MSEQLHAALALAALGYAAFPCRDEPDDKRPLTPNGFKDATTDEVVIRAAWHKRANAGVGIRTGKLTDGRYLVVLDVDGDKGSDSLAELEREYGELPATVSATTWRGQHYYFLSPRPVRSSTSKLAAGLDVRGEGAYVWRRPAVRASGTWLRASRNRPVCPTG